MLKNKTCRICKKTMEIGNFYKVGGKLKGHRATCIVCYNKKRQLYVLENKVAKKEYDKTRYKENRDLLLENSKNNYNLVKKKKYDKEYRKLNAVKVRFWRKKYKMTKIKAMPSWLTKEQIMEIEKIYSNCPDGYQVDHIIPLQHELLCGLHVPWNLQYLTEKDNKSKKNNLNWKKK